MKSLKYLASAVVLFAGMNAANAQQNSNEKSKSDNPRFAKMKKMQERKQLWQKELNLSDAQLKQMKEIRSENADRKTKLRGELKELRMKERERMQEVYTPEQKQKMDEMRKKRQERMQKRAGEEGKGKMFRGKGKNKK